MSQLSCGEAAVLHLPQPPKGGQFCRFGCFPRGNHAHGKERSFYTRRQVRGARSGMIGERVAPRPKQRNEMGLGLRSQSQTRPQPQQGRPFTRPGVSRFTSSHARVTPSLAPQDRTKGPCKGDCPQLNAGETATSDTPPSPTGAAPNKESTGRLRWCGCTRYSDVRTR